MLFFIAKSERRNSDFPLLDYVIAERDRMLTLDAGDSRPLIGQQTFGTLPFGKKVTAHF
jgi:hypothetical protein